MEQNDDFRIKEINIEPTPLQQPEPKKKIGGLVSLFNRKNLPRTVFFIILLFLLIAVGAIIWGQIKFSKNNVELNIKTPQDIASGKEFSLTIEYKNNNRVKLNNAILIVDFPSGVFSPNGDELPREIREIGTISKKSIGQEDFRIRFVGDKGEFKNVNVRLEYMPQNISSRFENFTSARIEVNSALIGIKVDGPSNVMAGQEAGYLFEYENKTNTEFSDLRIELEYDADFKPKNIEPQPKERTQNVWEIKSLKAGEKRSISLIGTLQGEEGEDKVFKMTLGKIENGNFIRYSRSEYSTKIALSPLLLFLDLEGTDKNSCNINSGDHLRYIITFKNNTDVALGELILKINIKDSVFDFRSVVPENGFFDSRYNVITWSGGEIEKLKLLEPGDSGEVEFRINLKKPIPMNNFNDKNFQAIIVGEIGTLTVPIKFAVSELKITNELSCKINSDIDIKSKGYYYDPGPDIVNTGPIPPKVHELTYYTIHWQITNTTNDIENLRVSSVLPEGIVWVNKYINKVSDSQFFYNERTSEISWEIKKMPAGTGYILPVYEFIFQIGLRPSINQVGSSPVIINQTYLEGKDSYTGKFFRDGAKEINTLLPDDPKVGYVNGKVVE